MSLWQWWQWWANTYKKCNQDKNDCVEVGEIQPGILLFPMILQPGSIGDDAIFSRHCQYLVVIRPSRALVLLHHELKWLKIKKSTICRAVYRYGTKARLTDDIYNIYIYNSERLINNRIVNTVDMPRTCFISLAIQTQNSVESRSICLKFSTSLKVDSNYKNTVWLAVGIEWLCYKYRK